MPKLEQFEIKKYWQIFSGLKPKDNKYLSYDQVKPILYNSKLDSSIISQIWNISDIDDDDCLDFEEFVICMRLIFDMVNKTINEIPKKLPDWLIPGSKVELLKQKELNNLEEQEEFKQEENISESKSNVSLGSQPQQGSQPREREPELKQESEPVEEEDRPDVDWYMSPNDKGLYDTLYNTSSLNSDGTITFSSLISKLKYTILISNINNIQELDLKKVWNLCNPSKYESIDKDPALYFMHIVKQMNDLNCKIPVLLPESLKNSFYKNEIDTTLNSKQSVVNRTPIYSASNSTSNNVPTKKMTQGTDFSSTEDTDWEIVRLKKELNTLDNQYEDILAQSNKLTQGDAHLSTVRQQFRDLLNYKQQQLINRSSAGSSGDAGSNANNRVIEGELDSIEEQLSILQDYLRSRKEVLDNLNHELSLI